MGQICSRENFSESKKMFDFFNNINQEKYNFAINNYEENCQKIQSLSKNNFEKLGQMQQLRVDFIKEIREEIIGNKNKNINKYIYLQSDNIYNNYNNIQAINNLYYSNTETDKILYYIIIMTLTLKSYLKRNYISNELEKSLLELSIVILKRKYNNNDLKLILYHLSRMFEILFKNFQNIQSYININDYLSILSIITYDYNNLTKEEKYPFILTHIISLGEFFHTDYKNIVINRANQYLLMQYYVYLIINNHDFIIQNYSSYKKILMKRNNFNNYNDITDSVYNKNDLIGDDQYSENIMKKSISYEEVNKISYSIRYFFIICSQDTFTGKNIFYEFDNQLELGIKANNLENEINIIKFKEACFMLLFCNLSPTDQSSTMFLSFFEYFGDNTKFGIQSNDIYYEMIIALYDKFNNNKIFIDKYSLIISRIFIMEKENLKKENLIMDKLYNYIYNLNNRNNGIHNLNNINENQINSENIFFFINLIKYISFFYKSLKNIKTAYDILIYLTNFLYKLNNIFKKPVSYINTNDWIYENFNNTLSNFDYNKNDYYTKLKEGIQFPLSYFLASYMVLVNDFFQINANKLLNNFDFSIITTLTYLEISMIKNNRKKVIHIIINLLNIYIKILYTKDIIKYEDFNNNLKNNLRLINNETRILNINYGIFIENIHFTTLHLKIIYSVVLIILIEVYKKNSNLSDLLSKHKKLVLTINQYNNSLISYCFPNTENIQNYNTQNLIIELNNMKIYNIEKHNFQQIIRTIQKILFNDEDEDLENSFNIYRARTLYQRDKDNEVNINIDTNKYNHYINKSSTYLGNYILNDSFSHYSKNSMAYNRSYINMTQNQFQNKLDNSDLLSEKVILPYNGDDINNYSEQNQTLDIISDKGSSNLKLKI